MIEKQYPVEHLDEDNLGASGEALAAEYLISEGWRILERNWRHRAGELDIVAQRTTDWHGASIRLVIFVEVKTKHSVPDAPPEAHVTAKKRSQLVRLASHFMRSHDLWDCRVRIDVIAIEVHSTEVALRHYECAVDDEGALA